MKQLFSTDPPRPLGSKDPVNLSIQFNDKDPRLFTVRVHESLSGEDTLTLTGRWDDGHIRLTSMELHAGDITADIARVPIGRIRDEVAFRIRKDTDYADIRNVIYENPEAVFPPLTMDDYNRLSEEAKFGRSAAQDAKAAMRSTGRAQGRPPLPDDFLAWIAENHIRIHRSNPTRHIAALTAHLEQMAATGPTDPNVHRLPGEHHNRIKAGLPRETVKTWLYRSRDRGWIDKNDWGKPGKRLEEVSSKRRKKTATE